MIIAAALPLVVLVVAGCAGNPVPRQPAPDLASPGGWDLAPPLPGSECRSATDCFCPVHCDCALDEAGRCTDGAGTCRRNGEPASRGLPSCPRVDLVARCEWYCNDATGAVCNTGGTAAPAGTPAAFYTDEPGGPGVRLICVTRTTRPLATGECEFVSCRIPFSFTDLETSRIWLRSGDDGATFPAAPDCNPKNNAARQFQECTLG